MIPEKYLNVNDLNAIAAFILSGERSGVDSDVLEVAKEITKKISKKLQTYSSRKNYYLW